MTVNDHPAPIPEPLSKIFEMPLRVYYEDTDAGGVVYHANYLRFCERARSEWLRTLGFCQRTALAEERLAFMVARVEADFLRGAELGDALTVASEVEPPGRASLVFRQRVLREGLPVFACRVTVACVDMDTRRPRRLPATLLALLESR